MVRTRHRSIDRHPDRCRIALLAGSAIILLYGESPAKVYSAILAYTFSETDGLAYVLAIATPLIFSALAVSVCFKAGMFNIGVEGQYLVGMVFAAWAAINLDFLPGASLMWAAIVFGMLGGVTWAAIPAVLKVKTGAHEVVTTIMLNGIAALFVGWALRHPLKYKPPGQNLDVQTAPFPDNALVPDLGHVFGFGPGRTPLVAPSGGAGLGGARVVLAASDAPGFRSARCRRVGWVGPSRRHLDRRCRRSRSSSSRGRSRGWSGCSRSSRTTAISPRATRPCSGSPGSRSRSSLGTNPIGIVVAAFLWGMLARGELALQLETDMPREFIIIFQGILILSVVVTYELSRRRLQARQLQREGIAEGRLVSPAPRTQASEGGG